VDGGGDDVVDGVDGVVMMVLMAMVLCMDGDGVGGGALRVVHFAMVMWMVVVMMWWMVWMGVLGGGDHDGVDGDGVVQRCMDGNDGVDGGALCVVHFALLAW
jgi:hypothetical protein